MKKMKKILLIESDRDLLFTLKEFLEEAGYFVDPATNEEEAMRKIAAKPDLILLDGILSENNSRPFLQKIMTLPDGENIPVILLVESGDERMIDETTDAGVVKCFIKTRYKLEDLLNTVRRTVG